MKTMNRGVDRNCFTSRSSKSPISASSEPLHLWPPQIRGKSLESPNGPIFSTLYTNESRLKETGTQKTSHIFGGNFYHCWRSQYHNKLLNVLTGTSQSIKQNARHSNVPGHCIGLGLTDHEHWTLNLIESSKLWFRGSFALWWSFYEMS